jgi:hypothetical protein
MGEDDPGASTEPLISRLGRRNDMRDAALVRFPIIFPDTDQRTYMLNILGIDPEERPSGVAAGGSVRGWRVLAFSTTSLRGWKFLRSAIEI